MAKAIELFQRYGLRSVSMDDLAGELGASKKTLYQHIENKESLVRLAVHTITDAVARDIDALRSRALNPIDELFALDETSCQTIEQYDHNLEFQLRKYYPEVYQELEERRRKTVFDSISANLKTGIEQGLYREDINVAIVVRLYYSHMTVLTGHVIDPFKNFEVGTVMREILIYHIRGIASAKGLDYLEKKLSQNEQRS